MNNHSNIIPLEDYKLIHSIAANFFNSDLIDSVKQIKTGNINKTYLLLLKSSINGHYKLILQQINKDIFSDIRNLMINFKNISDYFNMNSKYNHLSNDFNIILPQLLPLRNIDDYYLKYNCQYWRIMTYISDSYSINTINSLDQIKLFQNKKPHFREVFFK